MLIMMMMRTVGARRKGSLVVVDTQGNNDEYDVYHDGNDDHVDLGGQVGARDLVRQSPNWGGGGCQLDIMKTKNDNHGPHDEDGDLRGVGCQQGGKLLTNLN